MSKEAIDFSEQPLTPDEIEAMQEYFLNPNIKEDAIFWRETTPESESNNVDYGQDAFEFGSEPKELA